MGYAPISARTRGDWLQTAERRWHAIQDERPDLTPALDLQRRLLTLVGELAGGLAAGRVPRLSLPPKYVAAKLRRGVPALAGEPIPLPVAALTPFLLSFCQALAEGGAGESAMHIRAAIESGNIEAGSLL